MSSERIGGDLNHFSSPKVEFGKNHFRGVYTCVLAHVKARGHGASLLSFSTCFFFEIESKCVTGPQAFVGLQTRAQLTP